MSGVPASSHGIDTSSANTWTANQTAPAWVASGLTGAVSASRYVGATASAAPASGTFAVGDFVIAQTGKVFVCTSAGTPGTWGQVGAGGVTVLNYTEITSPVTVSGTSGAMTTVITASAAITPDGSTLICAEFWAPKIGAGASDALTITLFQGSTELGRIATLSTGTQADQSPCYARRYFTPAAGTYTYAVKAWRFSSDGSVTAGSGGAGAESPAYLRLTSGA